MRGDTRVTVAVSRLLEAFGKRGRGASGTLSRGLGTSADRVVGVLWLLRSLEAGGDTGLGRWRCLGQSGYCPLLQPRFPEPATRPRASGGDCKLNSPESWLRTANLRAVFPGVEGSRRLPPFPKHLRN